MPTETLTLTDFLLARIAEDEAACRTSDDDPSPGSPVIEDERQYGRVVQPYADHPDFREEWRLGAE